MQIPRPDLRDAFVFSGLAMMAVGVALVHVPAALFWIGAGMFFLGLRGAR